MIRAARATLCLLSPTEEHAPKPTTLKWKQKTTSSTIGPFQAPTSGTSSSIDSHIVYSIGIVIPCTICTAQNHTLEVCPLMETFRYLCGIQNFCLQEIDHPSREPNLAFTQNPITDILPPPNIDDMIHYIRFVSSYIGNRIVATPTS